MHEGYTLIIYILNIQGYMSILNGMYVFHKM